MNKELIKYLITGVWNTAFGYLSFIALIILFPGMNYLCAAVISNILSINNAFICYRYFVFNSKGVLLAQYARFLTIYGAAFLLNMMLLPLAVECARMDPKVAQLIIWIGLTGFSFTFNKLFAFK